MTFTQPEQRVRTGARRVRVARAVPMKAAAIMIAALGIALIVTMGPSPASAQAIVIRECGNSYVVTRYNQDGTVKGVWNKQLSDEGTIYTAGTTWKLVEGNPDRFVSDGGAQLQVFACDATPGGGTRDVQQQGAQVAQVTSVILVGNNEKTDGGTLGFNRDRGQGFTTGPNSAGYRLTSVEIASNVTIMSVANWEVSIASDGGSGPGSTVTGGALTEPAGLTNGIGNSFTASGNGIDLAANTRYYVFIDLAAENSTAFWKSTQDNGENNNPAMGWTIEDGSYERAVSSTTTWTQPGNDKLKIKVYGYAKVAPALVSAEVNGTSLVLTYDNDLDTTSRTAAREFGIKFGGGALQRATAISISGTKVTLTVPEVRVDQVVTVSYTVPTRNPLKGSDGLEVDALTDRAVTVNTGPAYGRSATGEVRTAVYVTYTNADGEVEVVENRAASADLETLWDYFYDSCQAQRSLTTVHDYGWLNADGHRMQARNGWKWVEVQNAAGDVTGTRPMTLTECASHSMYLRQQNCANADWLRLNTHLREGTCPEDRTW